MSETMRMARAQPTRWIPGHVSNPSSTSGAGDPEVLVQPTGWPSSQYGRRLAVARQRSGYDESVLTSDATLRGQRIAVIATESSFLAGSIGVVSAERLTSADERAKRACLPLIAVTTSGGVRMQEGTVAFAQMVRMAAAVVRPSRHFGRRSELGTTSRRR